MLLINWFIRGALRWRSGQNATRSTATLISPAPIIAIGTAIQIGRASSEQVDA